MSEYYVALPFIESEDGPVPVDPFECRSESGAKSTAAALERDPKYVGAVAFQRTGYPDTGAFGNAEVNDRYGYPPTDLSSP